MLWIPDAHHPYASKRAWKLLLGVAAGFKPDIVVIQGDFGDCKSVGDHQNDKVTRVHLLEELAGVARALDELHAATLASTERIYMAGNHENRVDRYITSHAPALEGMVSYQEHLKLKDRGWTWVPYRTTRRIGKVHNTHDTGKAGVNAHRQAALAHMGSTIIGHTHRMAYDVKGKFGGLPYLAAMFGWLGDPETAGDYAHEANRAEWVHGCGVGLLLPGGVIHVQPVPFINNRAWVGGTLYSA